MKIRNLTEFSVRISAGDKAFVVPRWETIEVPDNLKDSDDLKTRIASGQLAIIEEKKPAVDDSREKISGFGELSDDKKEEKISPKRTKRSSIE